METSEARESLTTLITRVQNLAPTELGEKAELMVALLVCGARMPGFWSGEILPPGRSESPDWAVVHRFKGEENARPFLESEERKNILARFKQGSSITLSQEVAEKGTVGSAVTAIVAEVRADMHTQYWDWQKKIQAAQCKFPGYGGIFVQPPPPGTSGKWTTLLRFDNNECLDNWFNSPERQVLIEEANQFLSLTRFHRIESSFPGLFPDELSGARTTPRWKGAVMVLIGLFPVLCIFKVLLTPRMASLPPTESLALGTILSIALVTYVSMPVLVKIFGWWLEPPPMGTISSSAETLKTDLRGLALALTIFGGEIALAWQIK